MLKKLKKKYQLVILPTLLISTLLLTSCNYPLPQTPSGMEDLTNEESYYEPIIDDYLGYWYVDTFGDALLDIYKANDAYWLQFSWEQSTLAPWLKSFSQYSDEQSDGPTILGAYGMSKDGYLEDSIRLIPQGNSAYATYVSNGWVINGGKIYLEFEDEIIRLTITDDPSKELEMVEYTIAMRDVPCYREKITTTAIPVATEKTKVDSPSVPLDKNGKELFLGATVLAPGDGFNSYINRGTITEFNHNKTQAWVNVSQKKHTMGVTWYEVTEDSKKNIFTQGAYDNWYDVDTLELQR